MHEAPINEREEKLAKIWCTLLSVDHISRHDNFFALGGSSLLVVQLLEKLREAGLNSTVREAFEAPTLAVFATMLTFFEAIKIPQNLITKDTTEITPEMLPLIKLSQTEIDSIITQIPGGVANIQDIYGLTPLQDGKLYNHLMTKGGDQHLLASQMRFSDRKSLERYANALQKVIERNDILRTAIFWDGLSEPAQVVLRHIPPLLSEITLTDSNQPTLEQLNQKLHANHFRFEMTQAPLVRLMAAPEPDGSWVAVQLMHNLIIDQFIQSRLQKEVHSILSGNIEKMSNVTPFRHFVAQTRLGVNSFEHIQFFTDTLGDIDEPTLAFGLNVADRDFKIAEINSKLPQTLNNQLRMHARNLQVSLAGICHLAWARVLAKASGRHEVVFGTVLLSHWQAAEKNNLINGPMTNTLPMRLNIDKRSVEIAVRETHAQLGTLLDHVYAPLVLSHRCSGVSADLPLFNALLNYRINSESDVVNKSIPGITFIDSATQADYPLTLSVDDSNSSLCLTVQVISPLSAARICGYVQQTLESLSDALAHSPQQPIQKLKVMPQDELKLLLQTWNQTKSTHSSVCCLHQLFEAQVECHGNAIAIEFNGQTLSYSELNIQANRLAHHLIAQGVKPDDRIALCVERSTAMIVAILGILKAGCAYLPLDPSYSSQRLTNILLDANPIFLITDSSSQNAFENHQIPTIKLEESFPSELPVDNPDANKLGLTVAHLAYIIYTSGSTGKPKGVMVEHRNAVSCLMGISEAFTAEEFAHTSFSTSVNFDMSIYECFASLSRGTTLHIMANALAVSKSSNISLLNTVPSALTTILNADSLPKSLRSIHLIGEPLKASLIRRTFERTQVNELCNLYSLTETTFVATMHRFKPGDEIIETIGRPIDNVRIYLLDAECEPVLQGAVGEIYIGGGIVARGYLNHPELSAERFLPDPFNDDLTARMFRTGDQARYLPDGKLMYVGRVDQQVKVRGFRIEMGEIEARLVEHSEVYEAAVQAYGKGSDTRLVAYVVTASAESLAQGLRTYLSTLLPEYMVPVAYVSLPSLPRTVSGKLDRKALPPPNDEAFVRQQYEAPKGEMEKKLADIWRKLLNIDRISRHDNFFALGGHSLLIVNLVAQLRQIGLETSVKELFAAPTLAMLASTLIRYKAVTIPPNLITNTCTEITPEILPLISLTQSDIDSIVKQIPGGVANIQDIYGLTPLQDGMLYHHLMAKEGDPYLLVSQMRFDDWASLERYTECVHQMIERHDILRTAIFWDGLNEPAQVVLRHVPSPLNKIKLDESDRPVLEQLSQKFHRHRFRLDLTQTPLIRLMAAPESDERWAVQQLMHHSTMDHVSEEQLFAEIRAIWNGKKDPLPFSMPFRNFVAQTRLGIDAMEHTRFFTKMLNDIDEPTLAFGLSEVETTSSKINETNLKLSPALNDQLRAHARNLQVSLSSICHLAWAQVICNAAGRDAVVFGTVLLGRLQAGEGENVAMGPMINTLPIRLDIDERSVKTAVRDTHARVSALLAHEHAPLVLAQRCSGVVAGLPLFNALLNYRHNSESDSINRSLPGVTFIDSTGQTTYPLTLSVDDNNSSLCFTVQVISPLSATRISGYVQQSLESLSDALAHSPQQPVEKMKVMPAEERILLMHTWNQTQILQPPTCCLHELFEDQVQCDGNAVAVACAEQNLSYFELNAQANRLAHYLISQGVRPDDRIALCIERSTAMFVAILGILKAGCAYVPLDPVYSSQRLGNVLNDADPICLVADWDGRNALGNHQIRTINLDEPLPSELPSDNPDARKLELTPVHLAYIIYTSGSTGKPKGVMIEHRQVIRLFETTRDLFSFRRQDKWCLFHSFSFDVSVWELWGALLHGSQLSIVTHKITRSTDEFYSWLCASGITVLNQTPSAFRMLLRMMNISSRCDRLRYVIFAGEALDPLILSEWFELQERCETTLVNLYGTTETTVHATFQRLETFESVQTVGRPFPDLGIYLLDSHYKPVLLAAMGEIYISGAGVARGYLNRPELNAERFLPDPFNIDPTARMYRTGDLARYLPDGNLVFLGRMDQQVKIRGFRIELGEIEARLVEHPQVREAIVQAYGDGLDARLVAYVVADEDASLVQNLREYLSSVLPDYMVPAAYVSLSAFPLTPNGKLDRRALPAPGDSAFIRQKYEAPQSGIEEKLAQIWSELLNIDNISRHDNFFALGGNSLLIVRLLARIRQIGLDTTVREVFDAPTLAMLASILTRYKAVKIPPNLITKDCREITPEMLPLISLNQVDIDSIVAQVPGGIANIQDIYGLTPLQNGMLYHHLLAKEGDPYLMVFRMRFNDRSVLEKYSHAWQQVIARNDILRTAILWNGLSEPAQVVLRQVPSPLTEVTVPEHDKPVLSQLKEQFNPCRYRLDLTQAPLLRLLAASESGDSWVAMLLIHHSIDDQVTMENLEAEVNAAFNGRLEKMTAFSSFRHFVAEVRLGVSPVEHSRFFTEMLRDIDEPTLPFGLTDVVQDQINESHLKLSQTLNDQLRSHARKLQVSVASICHLAWAQIIAKASGRETVVFGSVLLGRLQTGEKNNDIVGPTINTLPLRINIDGRSVESAVRETHTQLSALLVHEHAPLVLAQRCSGLPIGLPLFNALLNYRHHQRTGEANTSLPGITFIDFEEWTNYPLNISVDDDYNSLSMSVQVMSPILATRICAYMQQSLESLSEALTNTPQQPVYKLSVMPPDELNLLLHTWNQPTVTQSPAGYLHHLFEVQAECDGQAIAVEFDGQSLSYSELNSQANRLAHYLIAQGVKPDDRVALCVERSTATIVGMLGILKAGCAYLPLDPAYSSQRLTSNLFDAEPVFLLTDSTGREALGDHQIPTIGLDEALPSELPIDNPDVNKLALTPAHLAYIIYTSGSTGKPKGVMVEHQHATLLFSDANDKFNFAKEDKWCLFHSICFDFSLWEMWGALMHGSHLSIATYDIVHSMDEFYDWICINGITVLNQTPSAFKVLMRVENIIFRCDHLRYVIFGGEAVDPIILKDWYETYDNGQTTMANMYGPSESALIATIWINDAKFSDNSLVPIGRHLSNKQIYLLDSNKEPVPLGAEGEIYIGGAGVARGYLNRLELTAERFLPNPFNKDASERMYRTGDLARYLPDGNLVFLGRVDQQVKIRGFRIELGEIEARLVEHPQVSEAAVQCFGEGSDARLVAYVVSTATECLAQNLRAFLSSRLPDYMVPVAYVCLPSLPLTTNGKLDRRGLPAPDDEAFVRQQYEAPQGDVEEKLAQIWCDLLKIDRISRNDNFFELGGHSLLVMHIVNKVKAHNMHIDVRGVFNFPVLKNLATQITNRSKRFYCDVAIPVRQHGSGMPLFLLPDGWGDSSYAFELAHDIDKNIPVYVLPWPSPDDKQPASIEEMAKLMITLIKDVQIHGNYAIAGYSSGGILAYEVAKQLLCSGSSVSFLGLIDTFAPNLSSFTKSELFLIYLRRKFSVFESFDDSEWWNRVSKLSVIEAVDEIQKTKLDLSNIDIEWEVLLSEQRYNYQRICAAYKIDSISTNIYLFKANDLDFTSDKFDKTKSDDNNFNFPKLGWEKYNVSNDFRIVSVDGNHYTMMTDPKDRSLLGRKLTKCLRQNVTIT